MTKDFLTKLNELKKLKLPQKDYAIFGSGPLAIRGIRDSRDIDIIVKQSLWDKLAKKYPIKNGKLIELGFMEIFRDWSPFFNEVDNLIDDSDLFQGIQFVKLKYVLEWKNISLREKDKKDIKLINDYLRKLI